MNGSALLFVVALAALAPWPAPGASWTTNNPMRVARYRHTATLLSDGKVLIAGGVAYSNGFTNSVEAYDPASGRWADRSPLQVARLDHTATLLPDGRVLVTGGKELHGTNSLSSAEIYNPVADVWCAAAPLGTNRFAHTATLLPNGKVLVCGGTLLWGGDYVSVSLAEIYDPATDR